MNSRSSLHSPVPTQGSGAVRPPGRRLRAAIVAAATAAMTALVLLPAAASAASPAAFTSDSTGSAVNKNHYDNKCDVYLNGGPDGASLPAGSYTYAVLAPSGQGDPNDPGTLLSSDSNADRTFTVSSTGVISGGTHPTSVATDTGATLIQLCPYADTPNGGGVYIIAICPSSDMSPDACKYDAFKVGPSEGVNLTALKTATGSFTRTFSWRLEKSVVGESAKTTTANTATFNYAVTATKSAGVDSGFVVSGQVQVFNANDSVVTGVAVTDAIGATVCTVTGGATTIVAGGSATFDYTCNLPNTTTAQTTGTNVATITWDKSSINSPLGSTTASAPFDFSAAPTLVKNCTTVTDSITGTAGSLTLGSPCATTTFNYSRTVVVPATGCLVYTNTAVESASGTWDTADVTVCRANPYGFTIGYWQNKNGQAKIAGAAATGLCTYLATFSDVLGTIANCNTTLAQYVYDAIKAANASGDGAAMFRAQFLATALSVYFSPSKALGSMSIMVPTGIEADGCMTINALLAYGNTNHATLLAGDKALFMTVKSLYDAINNNNAVIC